ncbi:hypothetical protein D3C83_135210 [compost metagenome]
MFPPVSVVVGTDSQRADGFTELTKFLLSRQTPVSDRRIEPDSARSNPMVDSSTRGCLRSLAIL